MNILSAINWMTDWVNLSGLERERSILEQKKWRLSKNEKCENFFNAKTQRNKQNKQIK